MSKKRPELKAPAEVIYDANGARKYASNSRMLKIQRAMAERSLELLALPRAENGDALPNYLLDLGCGSGISGEAISDAGYEWLGCDISQAMLSVAVERKVDGDLFESDLGDGLFFREGVFDACISVSTLQWIPNCERKGEEPRARLRRLFESLFKCLKRGARAVFQLYPQSEEQLSLISECAVRCGFVVSIVVDFPNSAKARKVYLILDAGSVRRSAPRALTVEDCARLGLDPSECLTQASATVPVVGHSATDLVQTQAKRAMHLHAPKRKLTAKTRRKRKDRFMDKDWVIGYKDKRRESGFRVPRDSKYTARKRKPRF